MSRLVIVLLHFAFRLHRDNTREQQTAHHAAGATTTRAAIKLTTQVAVFVSRKLIENYTVASKDIAMVIVAQCANGQWRAAPVSVREEDRTLGRARKTSGRGEGK